MFPDGRAEMPLRAFWFNSRPDYAVEIAVRPLLSGDRLMVRTGWLQNATFDGSTVANVTDFRPPTDRPLQVQPLLFQPRVVMQRSNHLQ